MLVISHIDFSWMDGFLIFYWMKNIYYQYIQKEQSQDAFLELVNYVIVVIDIFPSQSASNAESFFMSWRGHCFFIFIKKE